MTDIHVQIFPYPHTQSDQCTLTHSEHDHKTDKTRPKKGEKRYS